MPIYHLGGGGGVNNMPVGGRSSQTQSDLVDMNNNLTADWIN
jgi:hypothetical protein